MAKSTLTETCCFGRALHLYLTCLQPLFLPVEPGPTYPGVFKSLDPISRTIRLLLWQKCWSNITRPSRRHRVLLINKDSGPNCRCFDLYDETKQGSLRLPVRPGCERFIFEFRGAMCFTKHLFFGASDGLICSINSS